MGILIEIISGVYGYDTGKSVVRKGVGDEPFMLDEEKAERLFSLGVAKSFVNKSTNSTISETIKEAEEVVEENETINLENMTLDELKEIAEAYGLKYKIGTKKAKFVEEIKKAINEIEADEEIPDFNDLKENSYE